MGQTHERERLFSIHTADLRKVCPEAGDVFVCPICLAVFSFDKIGDLTIGHVWSESMRRRTKKVKRQKVLLCEKCNWTSGSRGEGALAGLREAMEMLAAGELAKVAVQVVPPPGIGEPVDLRGGIGLQMRGERGALTFRVHEGHPVYDRKAWVKAQQYVSQGACTVTVKGEYPFLDKWRLAQIGLLTSGYLLAFFAFGYRYALQTCLDSVRERIARSFEDDVDERLDLGDSRDTAVWRCPECNKARPEIECVVTPAGEEAPWHLLVSFREYHVRLPTPVASDFIQMTKEETMSALQSRLGSGGELFREPDYCVEGHLLAPR